MSNKRVASLFIRIFDIIFLSHPHMYSIWIGNQTITCAPVSVCARLPSSQDLSFVIYSAYYL